MTTSVEQNKREKLPRNVRLLQMHAFLNNLLFIIPVIVPFFHDVIGLNFSQFMICEAIFSATVILMEVPTGWISDVWTRRKTMIAGTIAFAGGFVLLWQANSFGSAVLGEIVCAIGVSLFSGTNAALLYDSLLEAGQEEQFRRLEGLRLGTGLYAVGLSSLVGGFLYQVDPDLPMILSVATSLMALVLCFYMEEPQRHKRRPEKHPLADMIETARYALHGHAEIAGIILLSAALFATTKTMMWMQQPYYMHLDIPVAWFGVLMAAGYMMGGAGGHFGHRLDGRFRNITVLLVCLAFVFFTSMVSGLQPGLHGIVLLLFSGSAIFGFASPRMQAAINRRVDSSRRATILSTANLMVHLGAIPLMIMAGHVTETHGVAAALLSLAGIVGTVGALSWFLLRGRQRG